MSTSQNLANNIKKLREAKGLSQEKLARLADVANNTLIKMESGENQNPTLVTLKKIAKAFGVSVDDLIDSGWYCKKRRGGVNYSKVLKL